MNGRVYDPVLGRFLSADPNVDDASDAQGFNRYSYVGNNPLGATDPTGYFKLWKDLLKPIADFFVAANGGVLFNVIYGAATGGGWQGAAAQLGRMIGYQVGGNVGYGFASGFSDSLLNGGSIGDAFRAGVIGGAQAYVAGKIGDHFGGPGTWQNELARAFAHGTLGGAVEEAQGGEFRHGFYAGFAGSIAGSITGGTFLNDIEGMEGTAIRTTIAAVIGGTASALGGGKFANGAQTAAFQHLFNAEAHREDFWESTKTMANDIGRIFKREGVDHVMSGGYFRDLKTGAMDFIHDPLAEIDQATMALGPYGGAVGELSFMAKSSGTYLNVLRQYNKWFRWGNGNIRAGEEGFRVASGGNNQLWHFHWSKYGPSIDFNAKEWAKLSKKYFLTNESPWMP